MRVDTGETECEFRIKVARSTDKLLTLLQAMYEPAPPEPERSEPQPPIPNSEIKRASELIQDLGTTFSQIGTIQRAVLVFYPHVTVADLKSPCRTKRVVRPRQIAMYLSKELTEAGLLKIGRNFGGRDHTTILHAIRKISHLCTIDPEIAAQVQCIRDALGDIS